MKIKGILCLLFSASISAQATELKEPKAFPLVESPELVKECRINSSHFYSMPGPADIKECIHVSKMDLNWENPTTNLRNLLPSTNIDLGNNDVFSFAPYGFIFKGKVKININNASIVSPIGVDILIRTFGGKPTVYSVLKYPNAENPTHYFITAHYAMIVYERKTKQFCEYYIPGDGVNIFKHEKKGLLVADINLNVKEGREVINAYSIDLNKICKS